MMEGPGANSEEKHEPASYIDTALVDSLKALDPEGPIREADIAGVVRHVSKVPTGDIRVAVSGQASRSKYGFGTMTIKIHAKLPARGRDLRLDLFRGVANWESS
jgi:hypothetical protein